MSKNVHVIGPYNTGTNLLFNIINNSECIDLTQNKSISIEHQHRPFGKHTLDIKIIENYLNNPDNLLIIMYKNVNNWLYSIKKARYDIKYTKLYFPVELDNKKFPNMIELYNFYYINYMSLLEKYPNAIFLDYKMVINKSTSYDYINNKFNKILMTPAKNHGKPVENVIEAKESYSGIQDMVKKFLLTKPKFKRSIRPVLIEYYET
jgi:hypothetical protein